MDDDGNIKLTDFGLTHVIRVEGDESSTLGCIGSWCGPEFYDSDQFGEAPTYASDVYAIGILCIEVREPP